MSRTGTTGGEQTARERIEGASAIAEALDRGTQIAVVLVGEGGNSEARRSLFERLRAEAIPVHVVASREMRRMSAGSSPSAWLAWTGSPIAADLMTLMASQGIVFVLAGLRYPGNVGFILRSAEVAGAAGVVLANDWRGDEWSEALRIGMNADRFMPVLRAEAMEALSAARRAGRRVIALETTGDRRPWEADLAVPTAVLIGGETDGLSQDLLEASDGIVEIPTRGFIPSYNVQAAAGIVLGEWLRQTASAAERAERPECGSPESRSVASR